MSRYALSLPVLLAFAGISSVLAQPDPVVTTPLADKRFSYPDQIPYQADTDIGIRGPQQGYNLCNSTTEGQTSMCQTAMVNSIDDFCLWAPPNPNSIIADTEGIEVAWCTKEGRGTRIIPPAALTGVQFMKTPDYLQVVGFIDQSQINMTPDDFGGELDPHGADLRGNPLGGLMYSNGFPSNNGNNNSFQQVIEWHNFMGGGGFCIKVCDPAGQHAADYCQHIFDRIGCKYNAPNAAQNQVFESCEGENQDFPGVYTDNGQVVTYTQPAESLGAISSMPYEPRIPASSNCRSFSAAELYTAQVTATVTSSVVGPTSSGSGSAARSTAGKTTGTRSGSASTASQTGGAATLRVSALASMAGVAFALVFLSL